MTRRSLFKALAATPFIGVAAIGADGKVGNKLAVLFGDGELGPANIADSNNIGYYSYQFPQGLEMPASRAEELEFFRLAYTREITRRMA